MFVPDTETPNTKMITHLSAVVGDVCPRHRNSLYSESTTLSTVVG